MTYANSASGVQVGDSVQFISGTYSTDISPTNVPTSEAGRITYSPVTPGGVLFSGGRASLTNKSFITLSDLRFFSTGRSWVVMGDVNNNSASYIFIDGCTFDSAGAWVEGTTSAEGISLRGTHHIFRANIVKKWIGSDEIAAFGEFHVIEDNDANWADAGHGTLIINCGKSVIRRNYVRNKWAGAREFAGRTNNFNGSFNALDNLIEDNTFYDCNYADLPVLSGTQWIDSNGNEGAPLEGWADYQPRNQEPGDLQAVKLAGTRTIFRNNLIVGSNESQDPNFQTNNPYRCNMHIVPLSGVGGELIHMQEMQIYHNTWFDNKANGITFDHVTSLDATTQANNNRFINNVMSQQALSLFRFQPGTSTWLATWEFIGNLMSGTVLDRNISTTPYADIEAFQTAFNAAHPGHAVSNDKRTPSFVNSNHTTFPTAGTSPHGDRTNARLTRTNFLLATGTPGWGTARPLATITTGSSGAPVTTLSVNNSYPFYANPYALPGVEADSILVGGRVTTVTGKPSKTQLTVSPAIVTVAGDPIYLQKYGAAPSVGIINLANPATTYTISDLRHLRTSGSATAAQSYTIAPDVTTTPNTLLVAVIGFRCLNGAVAPTIASVSSTFSGLIGGWTKQAEQIRVSTTHSGIAIFTAQVGGSASSGNITALANGSAPTGWKISLFELDTHRDPSPVVQSQVALNFATTLSMTLPAAPLDGSMVIGAVFSRGDTDGVTPGSGYSEIADDVTGTVSLQTQWKKVSPTTTVDWSGLAINTNVAAAIEIAVATILNVYIFATEIAGGVPALDPPILHQRHILILTAGPTIGAPTVAHPILLQKHLLHLTSGMTIAAPTLAAPIIGQKHVLGVAGLTTPAPLLDEAVLLQVFAGAFLIASTLSAGTPSVGAPTIGQEHRIFAAFIVRAGG